MPPRQVASAPSHGGAKTGRHLVKDDDEFKVAQRRRRYAGDAVNRAVAAGDSGRVRVKMQW